MAGSGRVPTSPVEAALVRLRGQAGGAALLTEWEHFDQAAVNAYGALTGEDLWVHTDPARAAASRFGGTIVQASLLMARFGAWLRAAGLWLPEPAVPLNYGFDRVRILRGLPVGAAVRGRLRLRALAEGDARIQLHVDLEAERDDAGKPVVAAEWIVAFLM